MKKFVLLSLILASSILYAGHNQGNEWQQTTLPDSAITHIQIAKSKYSQCIRGEIKNIVSANFDSRKATDMVMKQCEMLLTQVRQIFLDEKVPEQIADRYMKKTRTETARNTLKHLMFVDASKKMGQPIK
jgi:flavorubredoxin